VSTRSFFLFDDLSLSPGTSGNRICLDLSGTFESRTDSLTISMSANSEIGYVYALTDFSGNPGT